MRTTSRSWDSGGFSDGHESEQPASRPSPGKVTLTSRLPASRPAMGSPATAIPAVQRKASSTGLVSELRDTLSGRSGQGASRALSNLPQGGGAALDSGIASRVESATSTSLGDVRVHSGPQAAHAAHALSARAFTMGSNIYLGKGESASDTRLMAHEAAHTIQQGGGAPAAQAKGLVSTPGDSFETQADAVADAVMSGGHTQVSGGAHGVIQRDDATVTRVEELLSYGVFDWAITDSEATEALSILAALSQRRLTQVMSALGQTYKTRLLDNLPASAKQTSGYTKVLVAMGPSGVQPYIQDLLSYGVFDWAITDAETQEVLRIILALDEANQVTLFQNLGPTFRARFADNLARTATIGPTEQAALRRFFDATPDGEQNTLCRWVALRFNVQVGPDSNNGTQWDKTGLTRLWDVLQALPPEHVENNTDLRSLLRYSQANGISGVARWSGDVALGYAGNIATQTNNSQAGDPLAGVNRFDKVVRHEIGHRVDPSVNGSEGYCRTDAGGSWLSWDSGSGLAEIMVNESNGAIKNWADAGEKAQIVGVLQGIIDDRQPGQVNTRLEALPFVANRATDPAQQQKLDNIKNDNVVTALQVCFAKLNDPWYNVANGGVPLGSNNRIYQESYEGSLWTSYKQDARNRKVSQYQFRAHWEWFAEAYAAYYEPGPKGALLVGRDDATKAWFDANVDPEGGVDPAAATGTGATGGTGGPGSASPTT